MKNEIGSGNDEILRNRYGFSYIDQRRAGSYTQEVIDDLVAAGKLDTTLDVLRGKEVYRHLCLPCAMGTAINWVSGKRLVGDQDGEFRVGDILRVLIPFHARKEFFPEDSPYREKGFLIATQEGNFYHLPLITFAKGFGLEAQSVRGFETVGTFREFLREGGAVLLSVDNLFILEHIPGEFIERKEDKWKIFLRDENGERWIDFRRTGHVVALLGIEGSDAIIADSFQLPQISKKEHLIRIPIAEIDKYLRTKAEDIPKGIAIAKNSGTLGLLENYLFENFIPREVVESVRKNTIS